MISQIHLNRVLGLVDNIGVVRKAHLGGHELNWRLAFFVVALENCTEFSLDT